MGPGILIKSLLQGSFSLMVFGWAQILMDLQPLFVIITGEGQLHGLSHTFVGATAIALFSALTGKYLSEFMLLSMGFSYKYNRISWVVALVSAFIGAYSHVILDAIMHADVQPFFPFLMKNGLLEFISIEALHNYCMLSGLIGCALFMMVNWRLVKSMDL
jgi:membrane-bound metal-dependent hydrolase YbcI (DUF457 family)